MFAETASSGEEVSACWFPVGWAVASLQRRKRVAAVVVTVADVAVAAAVAEADIAVAEAEIAVAEAEADQNDHCIPVRTTESSDGY